MELRDKIKWLLNNRHLLINLDEDGKKLETGKTEVNIYQVDDNSYKFISKCPDHNDLYLDGVITKLD